MNIGFVSTWLERGGAYVTKAYISLLSDFNEIYIYARGGFETKSKTDKSWNASNVTYGYKMNGTSIAKRHFLKWVQDRNLDLIFFNEQMEVGIIAEVRKAFPKVRIGTYVDYYTQQMVPDFSLYDFLICNTKRHYSVFEWHPQVFYVPWGTDVELFKPQEKGKDDIVFFHSAGRSVRKGTKELIEVFTSTELCSCSKLVIHTQIPIQTFTDYSLEYLEKHNIQVIEKTVTAPGLYHLGDIYVYPTTLDGLGLTMYEALSCGLPVIATDCAPMNEIIQEDRGKLIRVDKFVARGDGYYWPLSIISKESLYECMIFYINNRRFLYEQQQYVRQYAVDNIDWTSRRRMIQSIFNGVKRIEVSNKMLDDVIKNEKKHKMGRIYDSFVGVLPGTIQDFFHEKIH